MGVGDVLPVAPRSRAIPGHRACARATNRRHSAPPAYEDMIVAVELHGTMLYELRCRGQHTTPPSLRTREGIGELAERPMRLADFIVSKREQILSEWNEFAFLYW